MKTAIECSSSGAEPEAVSQSSGMSCFIPEGDGHFSNNLDKFLLCFRNGSILCKIALFFSARKYVDWHAVCHIKSWQRCQSRTY